MAVLALAALWPLDAQSQTSAALAKPWDTTVLAGVLMGRPDNRSGSFGGYDRWFETAQIALVAGRHLTEHLKAEFEISTSAEGEQFVPEVLALPNAPFPVFLSTDRFTRVSAVHVSLVYQFFENQWAHPFVQIGAVGVAERTRTRRVPQHVSIGSGREFMDLVIAGSQEGPTTANHLGLVVGTGAKLYVTPRLFIRAETQLSAISMTTHLVFRAGLGTDF